MSLVEATASELARRATELLGRPRSAERDDALLILYEIWGRREPPTALVSVARQPADFPRNSARAAVIKDWAARDPARALEWGPARQHGRANGRVHRAVGLEALPAGHARLRHEVYAAAAEAAARNGGYSVASDLVELTTGVTYYYVVSAVNGGGESPNFNQASATAK